MLRPGESIPDGDPKHYFHKGNGRMRLRWKVDVGQYLEVYADRILPDGTVAPLKNDPKGMVVEVACVECGKVRLTRRRQDGSIPERCKKCFGNGLVKGGCIGRDEKHCWSCDTIKAASEFGPNASKSDLLASECRECTQARARERYQLNKQRQREAALVKRYGISAAEYDQMLDGQGGVCAICNRECSSGKRLAVDHCHDTDIVRGLLCSKCNQGIGLFEDDPGLLTRAAEYVRVG